LLERVAASEILLVDRLLLLLTQYVGFESPQRLNVVQIIGHSWRGDKTRDILVIQRDEFEREKDQ